METNIDIAALIISIFAAGFSVLQFTIGGSRQQKESTLEAYNNLQNDVFSELKKYDLGSLKKGDDGWSEVTVCLAKIEKFCVGINTNIYSWKILNRLGGGYFIEQYDKLLPVITQKRENDSSNKHYDEFEMVVNKLKKERGKKK